MFPPVFSLADLNGKNGFTTYNADRGLKNSCPVSGVGDVDGDGFDDIAIGSPGSNNGAGQTIIFYGRNCTFNASINLLELNEKEGFFINGVKDLSYSGSSVSGAGNITGNGLGNVMIGSGTGNYIPNPNYVVLGNEGGFNASFYLTSANGNNAFVVDPFGNEATTYSASTSGDLNHDGFDDFMFGAPNANGGSGQVCVIYGNNDGFPKNIDCNSLNGTNGFNIYGFDYIWAGFSLAGGIDVNGDGVSDLAIGAPGTQFNDNDGLVAVILGNRNGFDSKIYLNNLNSTNGFTIYPVQNTQGLLGFSVSLTRDINGDGIGDILCGAPNINAYSGAAYAIFGKNSSDNFYINNLNKNTGFTMYGFGNSNSYFGSSVTSANLNGDSLYDVVVADTQNSAAAVVYGTNLGFPTDIYEENLNGTNGFLILSDNYIFSVNNAGNFNGNGLDALILSLSNSQCVIFGNNETLPTPTLLPTPTITLTSTQTPEPGVTVSSTPTPSTSFGASHTSTPTPSTSFNPHHENPNSDDHGLSAGAIAGIAIGGVVALGAVIGTVWWHCHKHVHASVVGETPEYAELQKEALFE
jgi:glycosylphosphatidylinositol phospholipase D